MKKIALLLTGVLLAVIVNGQHGSQFSSRSKTKQIIWKSIIIMRNVDTIALKTPPDLRITNQKFLVNNNSSNGLNANETACIRFNLENIGEGKALQVNIKITLLNGPISGLEFSPQTFVGNVFPTEVREIRIPVIGTLNLETNIAKFNIETLEINRFDASPFEMEIHTKEFNKPDVNTDVIAEGIETESTSVEMVSLIAETDKNIPANPLKHPNRLALIIGNENYISQQQNLSSEVNVKYAINDARIFRDYALNTMGVKNENLFFLLDATAEEMEQNIEIVSKLASRIGSEAEIIFYYAGHSLPDESNKTPYLIPVDVSGSDLKAAIKLSDTFSKLSTSGAQKITVFLDACFSGVGRESGLLSDRAVIIKPKEEILTGNLVVYSASSGEQSALPFDEKQHGMFTYFLLKKLQETGGDVTYSELGDYISRNVSIESLRINQKEQNPAINISPEIQSVWKTWKIN